MPEEEENKKDHSRWYDGLASAPPAILAAPLLSQAGSLAYVHAVEPREDPELSSSLRRWARAQGYKEHKAPRGSPWYQAWASPLKGYWQAPGDYAPVIAHELGHMPQKWAPAAVLAGMGGGIASLTTPAWPGDSARRTVAALSTLAMVPWLAAEVDASVRGARLMREHGAGWGHTLQAGIGLPTYALAAAVPAGIYGVDKFIRNKIAQRRSKKMRDKETEPAEVMEKYAAAGGDYLTRLARKWFPHLPEQQARRAAVERYQTNLVKDVQPSQFSLTELWNKSTPVSPARDTEFLKNLERLYYKGHQGMGSTKHIDMRP